LFDVQTALKSHILGHDKLATADRILRNCVHCGFCIAACPTYQVLGNELDSPRGRIYLIKNILEGGEVSLQTKKHLDRCLMCRGCETICPSGVEYYELLKLGKDVVSSHLALPLTTKIKQYLLRKFLTSGIIFNFMAKVRKLKSNVISSNNPQEDKVLLMGVCVQNALAPNINGATLKILQKLQLNVTVEENTCCGAIDFHLEGKNDALKKIKTNIKNWYQALQEDTGLIISNASGCGAMIKDYPKIVQNDPEVYAQASFVASRTLDIAEYLATKDLSIFKSERSGRIAYHSPCTMQHWQKINKVVEKILADLGFKLVEVADSNLCCGAAGTYAIMQPKIANKLKQQKLKNLTAGEPEEIVSANIGCILHLKSSSAVKVRHWVELLC